MEEATVQLQQNYCYSWFNSILHHFDSPDKMLYTGITKVTLGKGLHFCGFVAKWPATAVLN